jgi:tripartite-type tricarboxylate transporter receptor subunit TctC
MTRDLLIATAAALFTVAHVGSAAAQAYPTKAVRIIVPFPAGGPTDVLARLISPKLSQAWGQSVVIDNRAGANQVLGSELAAKAAPDGYTLLILSGGAAINVSLYAKLPYDTLRDFTQITLIAAGPNLAVVHPGVPVNSVSELITYARSKPGLLLYGSSGSGSPSNLATELFKTMAKVDLIHVPYKGMAPAITDLLGGHLQVAFPTISAAITHARVGRLRALGVTTATRSPAAPELPTIAEAALPGYEASNWYGIAAPAKTPPAVISKIHGDIVAAVAAPDVRDAMLNQGMNPTTNTPREFDTYLRSEIAKWAKVVKVSGTRPE